MSSQFLHLPRISSGLDIHSIKKQHRKQKKRQDKIIDPFTYSIKATTLYQSQSAAKMPAMAGGGY